MGFWTWLTGAPPAGESPNANPASSVGPSFHPGDPHGAVITPATTGPELRGLPALAPSPWSGWPADWGTAFDMYGAPFGPLVDTAWDAIDLNASILASMPAYLTKNGAAQPPVSWLSNPCPGVYVSWYEFLKRLFWDFQIGEAFVLAMARNSQGYPAAMQVIPPYLVNYSRDDGYQIVGMPPLDPDDILHLRYSRRAASIGAQEGWWRGAGPLELAGARITAARLLAKYQADFLTSGGIPYFWLETDRPLTQTQTDTMLTEWQAARGGMTASDPAVATGGTTLKSLAQPSPKDVMLLEIEQWNEARIAIKQKVPPFLLGLPSGGDPMTYSNVSQLFDYHFRLIDAAFVKPVMAALSNWALPRGQSVELNSDGYTKADIFTRAQAYQLFVDMKAMTPQEVRARERFGDGDDDTADTAAQAALTGAAPAGPPQPPPSTGGDQ